MDIFKEIRERADILKVCDVLGIKLNRSYKAICPFADHKEKTASFSISPSKNIFCCFRLRKERQFYYFSTRIVKHNTIRKC